MNTKITIEALGISLGDILTTSYKTGPFEVTAISAPHKFIITSFYIIIRDHQVTSFTLREADKKCLTNSYINNVRRTGDRWATDQNDEIFVEKKYRQNIVQIGLFDEPEHPLVKDYPFQPGCDYRAGAGKVWHCPKCRKDFNSPVKKKLPYWCPACRQDGKFLPVSLPVFFIEAPAVGDWRRRPSQFSMTLNMEDYVPLEVS